MSDRTKRIVLIVAGVVLVVIVALVAWMLVFKDNNAASEKNDVKAAYKASSEAQKSAIVLATAFSAYAEDDKATAATKEAYEKAQSDFIVKQQALEARVADLDDTDVTTKYKAMVAQSDALVGYAKGLSTDYATAKSLSEADCLKPEVLATTASTVDTLLSTYDELVKKCQTSIAVLQSSQNKGLVAYGEAVSKSLADRRSELVAIVAASKSGDMGKVKELYGKLTANRDPDLATELRAAKQKINFIAVVNTLNNKIAELQTSSS